MALSAKKVREQITNIKLESAYLKPDRVSLTCEIGEYRYHVWLLWPSLDFIGSITRGKESPTVYRNLIDRSVKSKTVYLNRDAGEGKLVWEHMSQGLSFLHEKLAAELVIRAKADKEAHEKAVKDNLIAKAAPDLFKVLLDIVRNPIMRNKLDPDLYKQALDALNKCGETV